MFCLPKPPIAAQINANMIILEVTSNIRNTALPKNTIDIFCSYPIYVLFFVYAC